jgi:hypothetical protein
VASADKGPQQSFNVGLTKIVFKDNLRFSQLLCHHLCQLSCVKGAPALALCQITAHPFWTGKIPEISGGGKTCNKEI